MSHMPFVMFSVIIMCVRIVMTAWQWHNLQSYIKRTQAKYQTGYLAIGNHRGILKSTIVLLVVDENEKIVCLQVMKGISIFARFKELPNWQGQTYSMPLIALRKSEGKALVQANEQIQRAMNQQTKGGNKHDTVSTIN